MTQPIKPKKRRISDELIYETILEKCRAAGVTGKVKPEDIAREIFPEEWQTLLKRIRLFGTKLAQRGEIYIIRKGEMANPNDFKGVYRMQITPASLLPKD